MLSSTDNGKPMMLFASEGGHYCYQLTIKIFCVIIKFKIHMQVVHRSVKSEV